MEATFTRLGGLMVRHRWAVLIVWLGLLVPAAFAAIRLPDVLSGGGFDAPRSESTRVTELLSSEFPAQPAQTLFVVFSSTGPTVDQEEYGGLIDRLAADLAVVPGVTGVATARTTGSPRLVSADGRTTFASVALKTSDDVEARDMVPRVREIVAAAEMPSWLTAQVTGTPAVGYDMDHAAATDLARAERIGLPLALFTLVAVFGALVAAGLSLILGISAVMLAMGAAYLLGHGMELSSFVQNIVPMLGLGVGIDYSLCVVSRYREELAAGLSSAEAVERAMGTAGKAIAFSGVTVVVGLSGLLVPNVMVLRSAGVGGIMVVVASVLAALTLLPALLAVLGERVNSPRLFSRRPVTTRSAGLWHRWALIVMRRPIAFLLVSIVVLGALALPALRMSWVEPGATQLPAGIESRQAFEALAAGFGPGDMAPVDVVIDTGRKGGLWDERAVAALYAFAGELSRDPRVDRVESLVGLDPSLAIDDYQRLFSSGFDPTQNPKLASAVLPIVGGEGRYTWLRVVPSADPDSPETRDLVREIRGGVGGLAAWPAGTSVLVGGNAARAMDMENAIFGRLPLMLALVLSTTFVVLVLLLRSLVLPLKALLMNCLSVLASYGVLVLIFQDGVGAGLLGFVPQGGIGSLIPVFLFCLLFGLSMDYEIFLLTRMREAYDETGDNERAVALGLERSGRIVTSAALIMVAVFTAFALSDFVMLKEMGVGMSAAVLLDATLIRVVLVPATMRLLGSWNWWAPAFLRGRAPRGAGDGGLRAAEVPEAL